ncbi:MAG TPA: glycosyltransferase [Patescibacteria group bacterium]|nr:glycosyltransferase [Patescibacteria group bacterium]
MKISIVIPAKNEEYYLPKLLTSIRQQKMEDYEIIVADAGSTDSTRKIAASFGARVVDGGLPGAGRNRGAEVAQGDVIIFLDADVLLPHEFYLQECLDEMDERGLHITTCRLHTYDGTTLDQAMHGAYNVYSVATEHVLPHAGGFCLFVKRLAHETIKGFDEDVVFAEDHDYVRRLKKAGYQFGILRRNKILVSSRRLHKDGRFLTMGRYAFAELRILTRGPFKRRVPFAYEMGDFDLPKHP